MKRYFVSAFVVSLAIFSSANAEEVTALSQKASELKTDMPREDVVTLLGNATWASIPGDTGEYHIPADDLGLVLRWKNSPCPPVVVQFNTSYKVKGWDEGRVMCGEAHVILEPDQEYSCEKEDRSKFCK